MRIVLCSLLSVLPLAACGSDPPDPPQVIIESQVDPGSNPSAGCNVASTEWIRIGDYGNVNATPRVDPSPVRNDGTFGGQKVSVTCSVTRSGNGFNVLASTTKNGSDGGSITISGTFNPKGRQEGLRVIFTRADYGKFEGTNCYAEYSSPNGVMLGYESLMGVAAGKVWARAVCEKITRDDEGTVRTCRGTAIFRFENCSQ